MLAKLERFFFEPASPRPLAALRIGLSLILLFQAFYVAPVFFELYGRAGILQGSLNDFLTPGIPNITALLSGLSRLGLGEDAGLTVIGGTYFLGLCCLLLGWRPRLAAAVVWLLHLALTQSHNTAYGVDSFAHIMLFYLIWVPSRWSAQPSPEARLGLRVVQLHLAIAYLASGIEKGMGPQWWNGEAIWRSLMLPVYWQYDLTWLSRFPFLVKILGWGTLVVETLYPVFIFPQRTRKIWIALTVSLHLGISIFLGLHLFSLLMSVLTLSLFGVSAEPRTSPQTASASEALPPLDSRDRAPQWIG